MKRVLTWTWTLLLLNWGFVAFAIMARSAPPTHDVIISPRADGFVIYGRNVVGLNALVVLERWEDLEGYLNAHGLRLPEVSFTELTSAQAISESPVFIAEPATAAHKITWVADNFRCVLFTPDEASAAAFERFVRYSHIRASEIGFSITAQ
jgi:hypothetical protein